MEKISFLDFKQLVKGEEGIVLLGCGGELSEWVDGVTKALLNDEIITTNAFSKVHILETTGGRIDIAMVLNPLSKVNIGKMAMWRLQFGDCSWISDYVTNYSDQHGISSSDNEDEIEEEEELEEVYCFGCGLSEMDCICGEEDDEFDEFDELEDEDDN